MKAPQLDDAEEVARYNQILSDGDIARLLRFARQVDTEQDWSGDLYRLVVGLAATGARFSQLVRMQVRDVQTDNRRLLVPTSRKGKGKKQSHTAVPVGADVLVALAPALAGRSGGEVLLKRWRHAQAPGGVKWERDRRGAWRSASDFTRAWHRIRTLAELPAVVPYALRHSSIVRGIRAGLPIPLVAALHDTSTTMIERHYSRWITDGLDELAATAVVSLVPEVVLISAAG